MFNRAWVVFAALPLATACMGGTMESDQPAKAQSRIDGPVPARVMTWNVQAVGAPGTTEYDAALAVIGRVDADVVAINEVNGVADSGYFQTLAQDAGYPYVVVADPVNSGALRNAFLSRWPVQSWMHSSAELSGDANANDLTRLILEVLVDVPNNARDLTLVVEHWKSGTANSDEFRRAVESYRVAQAVSDLGGTSAFLLMGDMNEEIDNVPQTPNLFTSLPTGLPTYFALGADLEAEMAGPGIQNDPFYYLELDTGPDATALGALQLDGTDATRNSSGRRLDYLMASPTIVALAPAAQVYDSEDEGLPQNLPLAGSALPTTTCADASDHLPVFTDLTVPAAAACTVAADCDDGVFCNGAEVCNSGSCVAGADPCPAQLCDETARACVQCLGDADCNDGLFCNGTESCVGGACQGGSDPCVGQSCDESVDVCQSAGCGDGVCASGEDCTSCPADCATGSGAACGNGVCEAGNGEDCASCPSDCNGKQDGKPASRFCCGEGASCSDSRCNGSGYQCTATPVSPSCCGDGSCTGSESSATCELDCGPPPVCGDSSCNGSENSCSCSSDCGAPPATEQTCDDGDDDDCDGAVDCADTDCSTDAACAAPACDGDSVCEPGEDCTTCASDCSGVTGGKPANRYCCGDGQVDGPEGDGSICDGNY